MAPRAIRAVGLLGLAASGLLAPVGAEGPPEDCSAEEDGNSMLQKQGQGAARARASVVAKDKQDQGDAAATAAHGGAMTKRSSFICFSCNHGSSASWVSSCQCDAGWEGRCCDEPATCTQGMEPLCPQRKLQAASANCEDVSGAGPLTLGTAAMKLPKSLQGLFWLTKQGSSSSLASFATSKDGHGLSQIDLDPIDGIHLKVRVAGDRVWAFADRAAGWYAAEAIDLMYQFAFKDANGCAPANLEDAVEAQIFPYAHNLGIRVSWTLLLDFQMKLLRQEEKEKYESSVVWGRPSSAFGFDVASKYYNLVQIIDGNGTKLEPAYSDWLTHCKDEGEVKHTGSTPGKIWYHKYA